MIYFITITVFLTIFLTMYTAFSAFNKNKITMEERIMEVKGFSTGEKDEIENKSLGERIISPFYKKLTKLILRITPKHKAAAINKKLEKAGLLKNTTLEVWLYKKFLFLLMICIASGGLAYAIDNNLLKASFISLIYIILANALLNFNLSKKIQQRKRNILKQLPYTLDLITVSVEAGLPFDGAMARVVTTLKGDLCDEFGKSLKEIRMGIDRKIALKNMSQRCDVKELTMFITSLIQAEELGVSLGRVLRIESSNLRELRKQAAREKAMKAPVKMLLPLVVFIFPSIFIIILGPAVIQIINMFSNM